MKVVEDITQLIGETPIVKLNRLPDKDSAEVYVKLENFNPSGSVKDRAALNMILEAEKAGLLKPGAAIHTALKVAKRLGKGKRVLALAPDTGERYLSTSAFEA